MLHTYNFYYEFDVIYYIFLFLLFFFLKKCDDNDVYDKLIVVR